MIGFRTHFCSLTLRKTSSWKTTLIPWPVVREICQPLQEVFGDASVLKVVSTRSGLRILESEISAMKASCLLRKLLAINTYDYQQCDVAVEAPHPDEVVLRKISDCYIGEERASGISDTIDQTVIPLTNNDVKQNQTLVLFCKNGLPIVIFAHAILTTHAYLLGPSLMSEDVENPLLATAEYINNMGVLRTAWLPINGTTEGDPVMINRLNENLRLYTSQGILLHRAGIKGPNLEEDVKLAPRPLLINMDTDLQALDRKKVRALLRRMDGKSVPSSTPPALETIEEWNGVDPFGEWEGESNPNPNVEPPSGFDFSILDEPPIGKPETGNQLATDSSVNSSSEKPDDFLAELPERTISEEGPSSADSTALVIDEDVLGTPSADSPALIIDEDILYLNPTAKMADLDAENTSSTSSDTAETGRLLYPMPEMTGRTQWQQREQEEDDQLHQAADTCHLLDETQLALIPRFPSPWRYIPRPPSLPQWLPGRDSNEALFYHPLVDRLYGGGPDLHARHRSWWRVLPIARPSMLRVPEPQPGKKSKDLPRFHYNHKKTRLSMGAINFWLGTLCHICGLANHPRCTCVRPSCRTQPSLPRPCPYCQEDHVIPVCVMLYTRCKNCDNLGHYPALCSLHSRQEWYHHFLIFAHLGLLTGTNEMGPQLGRFGFGYVRKAILDHPTIQRLERDATEKIQGTFSMLSDAQKDYVRKLAFVLDAYYLVLLIHVARAQLILLLRGGHIGDPEVFRGSVMERASEVEWHRHLTTPWLPNPPGQLPAPPPEALLLDDGFVSSSSPT